MKWILITDRLPEHGQKVWYYGEKPYLDNLVLRDSGTFEIEEDGHNCFLGDRGGFLSDYGGSDVSHWMPNVGQEEPAPPNVELPPDPNIETVVLAKDENDKPFFVARRMRKDME